MKTIEAVPCRLCSAPTLSTGTKLCDRCWELKGRIRRDPELARKILDDVEPAADEGVPVLRQEQVYGVCCQYCQHFKTDHCPVTDASPWSRWRNFCSEYSPDRQYPDARELIITTKEI